jgi:hypothetical protein
MADPIDDAALSFAAALSKLKLPSSPAKSVKATKARAKAVNAKAPPGRLKKSGRTELWGIRCKPGLKERCQEIARELGKLDSEWAEEIFMAAIAAYETKKS